MSPPAERETCAPHRRIIVLAVGLLFVAALTAYSRAAMLVILLDGAYAAAILIAAFGLGIWLIRPFGGARWPRAEQVILGACLGVGVLPLLVLGLGSLGILSQGAWRAIVIGLIAAALIRLRLLLSPPLTKGGPGGVEAVETSAGRRLRVLWLLALPFLFLALLAACVPPGMLWPAEGNGYDVLEYHLAAPKEFLLRGRVEFLPHNIYANLPFSAEMIYLLAMILHGRPLDALYTAQFLHVGLGVLAVAATWLSARPFGRLAAIVAGLGVACCPMVAYLSGLAYVENGLLVLTAASLACLVRIPFDRDHALRWSALAGTCAGLACGFKATAAPMIALPVAIAMLLAMSVPLRRRLVAASLAALCAAAAFSPWLIKNYAATGNPFFPLGRGMVHERPGIWSDALAARWHEGHLPDPAHRSALGRLAALADQVLATRFYALLPWLPLLGLLPRRRRDPLPAPPPDAPNFATRVCLLLIGFTLFVWLTQTHLVDRFAIGLIVPAAVLTGIGVTRLSTPGASARVRVPIIVILAAAWVFDLSAVLGIFRGGRFAAFSELIDQTGWVMQSAQSPYAWLARLNPLLAAGSKVLLVAEARTLYLDAPPERYDYRVIFNHSPFAEAAAARSPAQLLVWLREEGFDYVFVHWGEMRRLRQSRYGFWPGVDKSLFDRLTAAGLAPVEQFRRDERAIPHATLYRVPG